MEASNEGTTIFCNTEAEAVGTSSANITYLIVRAIPRKIKRVSDCSSRNRCILYCTISITNSRDVTVLRSCKQKTVTYAHRPFYIQFVGRVFVGITYNDITII